MRKLNIIIVLLVSVSTTVFINGCAGGRTSESTGEYIDDSVLTAKVKTSIFSDPMLKSLQITVETYKGIVQLSGFVNSKQTADRAIQLAREVRGVKQVNNSLIVK